MKNKPNNTTKRRSPAVPDATRRVVAGDRDRKIARFLLRFGAATGGHLREAFGLSVNGNRVLRRLFDAQIVRRHSPLLTGGSDVTCHPVYTLGPAAAPWVAEWENIPLDEARKWTRGDRTPSYLAHALSIVDLFLSLQAALGNQTDWALRGFLVERECLDELAVVSGKAERRVTVRPDAVAVFRRSEDGALFAGALESDLGNVRAKAFAHKCDGYRLYVQSGAYREAYPGVHSFSVLVVAGTDARCRMLAQTARDAQAEAYFQFATRPDIAKHGFFGPIWRDAGGAARNPLPLIETNQPEGERP